LTLLSIHDTSLYSDASLYSCNNVLNELVYKLEHDSQIAIEWFSNNFMKLNPEKCHFMICGHKYEHVFADVSSQHIWESSSQKLLGVTIDNEMKFDSHIANICSKVGRKISALARVCGFLSEDKKLVLLNSFINSQFSYCPLIWMMHSRTSNNMINHLQERALRLVYNDYLLSFDELLIKAKTVTIHHKNIHHLATEMYKVKNNIATSYINDIFTPRAHITYNLRNASEFQIPNVQKENSGKHSLSYLGPKVWQIVPKELKDSTSLNIFKTNIKLWIPKDCPCRICRDYLQGVGYI